MMNYRPKEVVKRIGTVAKQLEALTDIYGDFKTLNSSRASERQAFRVVIDDLRAEQDELTAVIAENRIIN